MTLTRHQLAAIKVRFYLAFAHWCHCETHAEAANSNDREPQE